MKGKLIILLIVLFFAGLGGLAACRSNAASQETATATLFRPYFNNVLSGKLTEAYDNFTDDYYKSEFALDDYLAIHDKTLGESGKFVGYDLGSFRDCGSMFSARATLCASVSLRFERGEPKIIQYQIQPGAGDKLLIHHSGKETDKKLDGFPF